MSDRTEILTGGNRGHRACLSRIHYTKAAKSAKIGFPLPSLSSLPSCKPALARISVPFATFVPSVAHPICGSRRDRGSLILVVLCLLAVLGIALASFLAIGNQSMKLSNRSYRTSVSAQLAEMGLEEALRAFNTNNWADWTANGTSADWTTSGTTATCTITFPATKFGQGVTGTVNIRVDNFNANQLDSVWSSTTSYRVGNLVSYTDGIWYRCTNANTNMTPSASTIYWMQEQAPISPAWASGTTYATGDMVCYNNAWYRCVSGHSSSSANLPPNATYWLSVPYYTMDADLKYTNEALLNYYGTWYRYLSATGWDNQPPIKWRWRTSQAYVVGDTVCYSKIWYRCIQAHTSSGSIYPTNPAYWSSASTLATSAASAWDWNAGLNYNLGDVVYRSSRWYRCIQAHTNQGPPNTTYWSTAPLLNTTWNTGQQYSTNDTVFYNGVWYLSLQNTNAGQNPSTATTYWIGANTNNTSYQWNTTTNYSAGAYRCYGGIWYKCLSAGSNKTPNNSSYWTASWAQSSGVTTGAPVIYAESTVTLPDGSPAIKTQLRAPIAPASLFPNAAASTSSLTITSGTGTVDSYDNNLGTSYASQVGNTATNYSAVLTAGTTLAINGTTAVRGYLAWPSPPSGISTDTTVQGPSSPASPKVDSSRVSRSPYLPQFDPLPSPSLTSAFSSWNFPYGTTLTTNPGGTVTIGNPGATTPACYYYNGTLDLASSLSYEMATLNINGPVKLYINGNLITRSGGTVVINSAGSAEIHVDGYIRLMASTGGFLNNTLDPKKLILISDVTSTSTQYLAATTNPFYGIVYIPNTTTSLGLDIRTGVQIYGAVSAKKIYFRNEANVHYDTSLRYATIPGVDQPWAVTEWRELTDPAERAVLP